MAALPHLKTSMREGLSEVYERWLHGPMVPGDYRYRVVHDCTIHDGDSARNLIVRPLHDQVVKRSKKPLFGNRAGTNGHPLKNVRCSDCGCTYRGNLMATCRVKVSSFNEPVLTVQEARCPVCESKNLSHIDEEMVVVEVVRGIKKEVYRA